LRRRRDAQAQCNRWLTGATSIKERVMAVNPNKIHTPAYARAVLDAFPKPAGDPLRSPSAGRADASLSSASTAAPTLDEERFYKSDAAQSVAVGVQAVRDILKRVEDQHPGLRSYSDAERLVRQVVEQAATGKTAPLHLDARVSNGKPELVADFIESPFKGMAELGSHLPVVGPVFSVAKHGVSEAGSALQQLAKVLPVPTDVVEKAKVAGNLSSIATTAAKFAPLGGIPEYARAIRVASDGMEANDLRNFAAAKQTQCTCCTNNVKKIVEAKDTELAKAGAKANPLVSVAITAHDAIEGGIDLAKKWVGRPAPSVGEGVLSELLIAARDTKGTSVLHRLDGDQRCTVALEALVLLASQRASSIEDTVVKVSAMMLASDTDDAVKANKSLLPAMGSEKGERLPRHQLTSL
jgi:hypothetical protein